MKISEQQINIPAIDGNSSVIEQVSRAVEARSEGAGTPVRWAMIGPEKKGNLCEFDSVQDSHNHLPSIFEFRRRSAERTSSFNAAMLIPTGVDCAIGGHAGDATPSARLLAGACDNLVLHPNVVNASDINEQAPNCLYVEGSLICRLLMGTASLRKVRKNRVLLVTEDRPEAPSVVEQTINCAEGARATLGMDITGVVVLPEGLSMKTGVSATGRVTGCIERMQALVDMLASRRGEYDAIALATKITPHMDSVALHHSYFEEGGANPWGGVEAVLTHTISAIFDLPSAHAPTLSNPALRTESWGVVEPRKAAEVISTTYLFCVLKGLHQAPRVEVNYTGGYDPSVISAEDISALVIPDGCVGLPTLAALEQGIPVIAVRGNTNLMRNDLSSLPFAAGQLLYAENYYEAAGMLSALRMGVTPAAVVRPMLPMPIYRGAQVMGKAAAANGKAHANGKSNGKVTRKSKAATNGHSNGHTNGHSNGNGKHVAVRA